MAFVRLEDSDTADCECVERADDSARSVAVMAGETEQRLFVLPDTRIWVWEVVGRVPG